MTNISLIEIIIQRKIIIPTPIVQRATLLIHLALMLSNSTAVGKIQHARLTTNHSTGLKVILVNKNKKKPVKAPKKTRVHP
jgi:hypothetical protein